MFCAEGTYSNHERKRKEACLTLNALTIRPESSTLESFVFDVVHDASQTSKAHHGTLADMVFRGIAGQVNKSIVTDAGTAIVEQMASRPSALAKDESSFLILLERRCPVACPI